MTKQNDEQIETSLQKKDKRSFLVNCDFVSTLLLQSEKKNSLCFIYVYVCVCMFVKIKP